MTTFDERPAPRKISAKNWRNFAACRDSDDPDLYFPLGVTNQSMSQAEDAKAVCFGCAAIDWCLRWALDTGQDFGVWGGLSEDDRRALKRREARVRQKAAADAGEALADEQLLDGLVSS